MTVLIQAGQLAAAIAAIVACWLLIVRLPPVRWVWYRSVIEPVEGWVRHIVRAEVKDELDRRPVTNGRGVKLIEDVEVMTEDVKEIKETLSAEVEATEAAKRGDIDRRQH